MQNEWFLLKDGPVNGKHAEEDGERGTIVFTVDSKIFISSTLPCYSPSVHALSETCLRPPSLSVSPCPNRKARGLGFCSESQICVPEMATFRMSTLNNITEHQRVERKIKPVMCPKPELQLTEVTYTYANHIIFTTAVSKIKKKHKCCMQFSLHKEASFPLSFAHISVHPALSILIIFSKQLNPERGSCCNN